MSERSTARHLATSYRAAYRAGMRTLSGQVSFAVGLGLMTFGILFFAITAVAPVLVG